ncbi:MAG: DUF6152 family protein, partial [Gammaproteobacteria bacterium]
MRKLLTSLCIAIMIAAFAPASAHHGPGPYDRSAGIVLENATVTAWRYVHPHASVLVEIENDAGVPETWTVDSESPNILRRVGVLADF